MAVDRKAMERDLSSQVEALAARAGGLKERLAAHGQLVEAWASFDDHLDGFRIAIAAILRVDPEDFAAIPELKARMESHVEGVKSALTEVEVLALRLATFGRLEAAAESTSGA